MQCKSCESLMLRDVLKEIVCNDFKVCDGSDYFNVALEMMDNIGSPNPELRDGLIYKIFANWIKKGIFSSGQLKQLLNLCVDDAHLFYKIGEKNRDSVFTRSFSVLLLAVIIYVHRKNSFLSRDELIEVKEKLIDYALKEKDVRGYLEDSGWAHSAAHTADALDELALCPEMGVEDLLGILDALRSKAVISYYPYVNEEDERMAYAASSVLGRKLLTNAQVSEWLEGFEHIEKVDKYPEAHNLASNRKNFLRSLYFRLMKLGSQEVVLEKIKEVLFKLSTY